MHGLMCSTRSAHPSQPRGARISAELQTPVPRAGTAPVDDSDRAAAQQLLSAAFRDDQLHVDDFEAALTQALRARTVAELERATDRVPPHYVAQVKAARTAAHSTAAAAARRRAEAGAYLRVMALLLGIWMAVGVAAGAWYPWPIWPALGWGIPLLASSRRARRDYDLRHATFTTDPG